MISIQTLIERIKTFLFEQPGSDAVPSQEVREIHVSGNAPLGAEAAPVLSFVGRLLIEVEQEWDDERNTPLRPGTIGLVNRLAIYRKEDAADQASFVAEQQRYSVGPVIVSPEMHEEVLVSLAAEFTSFNEAVDWIYSGDMVNEGTLRESLKSKVQNFLDQPCSSHS